MLVLTGAQSSAPSLTTAFGSSHKHSSAPTSSPCWCWWVSPRYVKYVHADVGGCVPRSPLFLGSSVVIPLCLRVCQVLCVGTQTVFIDNANEEHNMILLKHFTEKNHAAVVDVKTRKRKTGWFSFSTQRLWLRVAINTALTLCVLFLLFSEGLPTHPVSGFHCSHSPRAARGPRLPKGPA